MADNIDTSKRLPRGALPSPRHELAAATPFAHAAAAAAPASFLQWPTALSYWDNSTYGDCVSAEEAFAKACASPQVFIPQDTVVAWASAHGYLNGAVLTSVMRTMQTAGFSLYGKQYDDGAFQAVNWHDDANLQSAIFNSGPVKLGVGAESFQSNPNGQVSPGTSGWTMHNYPMNQPEDHCVALCGYGTLPELIELFQQRGVAVNVSPGMPNGLCYAMFTWNSIGIIDKQSMLNMTYEAWVRTPVTIAKTTPTFWLTTQGSDGIWAFDPATKARPVELPPTAGLGFSDVIAIGHALYMTTHGGDGVWIYDILLQGRPIQAPLTSGLGFKGLVRVGPTLYLTTQGSDGIWTFDLAFATRPAQISTTTGLGFSGVIAVGSTLYLTTHGSDGIWTFDLNTHARPVQIPTTTGLGFKGLVQIGSTLYLTTQGSDGIWTFDLNTHSHPVQIPTTTGLGFTDILAIGQTLYLTTHGSDGIWTFDTASRTRPVQIASTTGLGFVGIVNL